MSAGFVVVSGRGWHAENVAGYDAAVARARELTAIRDSEFVVQRADRPATEYVWSTDADLSDEQWFEKFGEPRGHDPDAGRDDA